MKKIRSIKKIYLLVVVIILAGLAYAIFGRGGGTKHEFLTVKRGTVTQQVAVTGQTEAVKDLTLGFQRSGVIAHVYVAEGDRVAEGQTLAVLDTQDLSAQYAQAKANVEVQAARLKDLQNGPRPEDLQVKMTAVTKAEQDLTNLYQGVPSIVNDAYLKSDDAVRKQVSPLFLTADTSPQLSFPVNDTQLKADLENQRAAIGQELSKWKSDLSTLPATLAAGDADQALQAATGHLLSVRKLLDRSADAVAGSVGLASSTMDSYKANITVGRTNVNTALSTVSSQVQTIASEKIVVQQAKDALALTQAGNTAESIAAQAAAVTQAQAAADSIAAQLSGAYIKSPIAGVITDVSAKVGQVAGINAPLITVISDKQLDIKANVPEVDVGKLALGQKVNITLDAFPGETFTGKVAFIDAGPTLVGGAVNYQIKVLFDTLDARFKSGLTANLNVVTQVKPDVLTLPDYAILETDQGTFVKTVDSRNKEQQLPVKLGIRDQGGTVEILSGASEGQQVVNIGKK